MTAIYDSQIQIVTREVMVNPFNDPVVTLQVGIEVTDW
jgi:hypothetical protein